MSRNAPLILITMHNLTLADVFISAGLLTAPTKAAFQITPLANVWRLVPQYLTTSQITLQADVCFIALTILLPLQIMKQEDVLGCVQLFLTPSAIF